jgi:hypothetical protein
MNQEVRNTPRARRLLAHAVAAKASFADSRSWIQVTQTKE